MKRWRLVTDIVLALLILLAIYIEFFRDNPDNYERNYLLSFVISILVIIIYRFYWGRRK